MRSEYGESRNPSPQVAAYAGRSFALVNRLNTGGQLHVYQFQAKHPAGKARVLRQIFGARPAFYEEKKALAREMIQVDALQKEVGKGVKSLSEMLARQVRLSDRFLTLCNVFRVKEGLSEEGELNQTIAKMEAQCRMRGGELRLSSLTLPQKMCLLTNHLSPDDLWGAISDLGFKLEMLQDQIDLHRGAPGRPGLLSAKANDLVEAQLSVQQKLQTLRGKQGASAA